MGGEPDDGIGTEDPAGHFRRGVVLADVDTVRLTGQGQVGPVVEDERHPELGTHRGGQLRPGQERAGIQLLLPQLDHVHPAPEACAQERRQIGPVRRAQVEPAPR